MSDEGGLCSICKKCKYKFFLALGAVLPDNCPSCKAENKICLESKPRREGIFVSSWVSRLEAGGIPIISTSK